MIKQLRVRRYKGFLDFTLNLPAHAVIVGPNNAGKTTLVHCLRLASGMLRHARKKNAVELCTDDTFEASRQVHGHRLQGVARRDISWFKDENIRHEFREDSSGFELTFSSGARLRVVWPVDGTPFFYVEKVPGVVARSHHVVRDSTPIIGVIPTLAPADHREEALSEAHVRDSIGTRLTSRHFRNIVNLAPKISGRPIEDLVKYIIDHTPEITDFKLKHTYDGGAHELDLYVTEAASATDREVYWVGDGMQVWLQIILHSWLNDSVGVLVLDEPDVYLHPDLQRRLMGLLDETSAQVVLATHAPELLAEAPRDAVVWVDKSRRSSRRLRESGDFAALNVHLGSGFNLSLARALRSKVALFVEGSDMKVLRNVARTLGLERVNKELGLAVIPLGGFSNWHQVEPFAWLTRDLLGESVKAMVLLDRDYREKGVTDSLVQEFAAMGVRAHVWERKELESYFLVPSAIARAAGVSVEVATRYLEESMEDFRHEAQAKYLARRQRDAPRSVDPQTTILSSLPEFDAAWADPTKRVALAPPKDVLASISRRCQADGGKAVTARSIVNRMNAAEVPAEMASFLKDVNGELEAPS